MKKKLMLLLTLIFLLALIMSPANAADERGIHLPSDNRDTFFEANTDNYAEYFSPKKEVEKKEEKEQIAKFTYIYTASSAISISNDVANASNYFSCRSSVDKITISSYIQVYDSGWTTIKHVRETTYNRYATLSFSASVPSGQSVRVRTYFYAYSGDNVESTSCTDTIY